MYIGILATINERHGLKRVIFKPPVSLAIFASPDRYLYSGYVPFVANACQFQS